MRPLDEIVRLADEVNCLEHGIPASAITMAVTLHFHCPASFGSLAECKHCIASLKSIISSSDKVELKEIAEGLLHYGGAA